MCLFVFNTNCIPLCDATINTVTDSLLTYNNALQCVF